MTEQSDVAGRVAARAAGLARYYRAATFNLLTKDLLYLILGGGAAIGFAAPAGHRALVSTAIGCVAVTAFFAGVLVTRYLRVTRRLRTDPAAEVARLEAHPSRALRRYLEGTGFARHATPVGGISDHPIATDGDPYQELRGLLPGGDESPDGVNRTDDPRRGPIE